MSSDDPADKRGRKGKVTGSWWTVIFPLSSIAAAIIFNYIDKGPPLPPFPDTFTSIDCHAVTFTRYHDRSGFLDFHFSVKPSVEYPPEYLPHFISIQINTPPTTMTYSGDEITNISRDSSHIQFSLVHTWGGPSTITAQCLHNSPQQLSGTLSDIVNFVPQYSRSDFPASDHAKFKDVCLEYEKFLYFVQVSGERPAVPFDDESLRFEMLKWPLDAYLKHKNVNMTHRTCFLVAPLSRTPWEVILLTLIPLAASVERNGADQPLFIFRKSVPDNAARTLRLLGSLPPVRLDDIMCFDTLLMTATYSRLNDRENRLRRALASDIAPLRRRVPRASPIARIALSENLWDALEFRIKEGFPQYEVIRVGSEELDVAIPAIAAAKVLVGDHIASLAHMVWLGEGAHVIDASPGEYACHPWARELAGKIGVAYARLQKQERCNCQEWRCYPQRPAAPGVVDYEAVLGEIGKALK